MPTPIKMIAVTRVYREGEGREYAPGQTFSVLTDREADLLEQIRKARRAPEPPTRSMPPMERPTYRTADLRAQEAAPAPVPAAVPEPVSAPTPEPVAEQQGAPDSPPVATRRSRYRTREMSAEN